MNAQDELVECHTKTYGNLLSQLQELSGRVARLEKRNALLVSAAQDAVDELNGYVDIEDGSDGTPSPNWAMRIVATLETAIAEAGRR